MNILIAEDEIDIQDLIELHLIKEGFKIFKANNGIEAIKIFENEKIDLALLDITMPKLSGIKVLQKIRETSQIPVIFLTAHGEESDKILGLGLGADDYIVKPFSHLELLARIESSLRRSYKYIVEKSDKDKFLELKVGELILNCEKYVLTKENIDIDLSAKEFKILKLLMKNPERIFTKKQIYESAWDDIYYGDSNTIMVHISIIREKIENNPKKPRYIKTIRGIGYKFVGK